MLWAARLFAEAFLPLLSSAVPSERAAARDASILCSAMVVGAHGATGSTGQQLCRCPC